LQTSPGGCGRKSTRDRQCGQPLSRFLDAKTKHEGQLATASPGLKENAMRLILFIIVILLLLGALPTWGYSSGWGYYPSGGLGLLLIVLIVLAVLGII
jgi:Protein of unknown function (DUF3309)